MCHLLWRDVLCLQNTKQATLTSKQKHLEVNAFPFFPVFSHPRFSFSVFFSVFSYPFKFLMNLRNLNPCHVHFAHGCKRIVQSCHRRYYFLRSPRASAGHLKVRFSSGRILCNWVFSPRQEAACKLFFLVVWDFWEGGPFFNDNRNWPHQKTEVYIDV